MKFNQYIFVFFCISFILSACVRDDNKLRLSAHKWQINSNSPAGDQGDVYWFLDNGVFIFYPDSSTQVFGSWKQMANFKKIEIDTNATLIRYNILELSSDRLTFEVEDPINPNVVLSLEYQLSPLE